VVATAERKEEVEEVVETAAVPAAEAASPEISVDRGKKDEEGTEK